MMMITAKREPADDLSVRYASFTVSTFLIKTALAHAYGIFRSSGGPRFAVIGLLRPQPLPELTSKYNSMLTYIPVSFSFSFKNFVPVRVKNRVRFKVSSRVRV